ncbi:MAG TPA: flagellin [Pirellulales bacterium]|nr:flagellin [Pirellulales bacterium]
MTRINTNVSSLIAQTNLDRSQDSLQTALTRLSTGLRINSGKDDPAGLIASQVLASDITSTNAAITNSQTADQLIGTANSALTQVSSLLNDIRGLVSQSANTGALSSDQIAANQLQVDSSLAAIDRISQTTSFQGRRLLDGSLDFITTATPSVVTTASGSLSSAAAAATNLVAGDGTASTATVTGSTGAVGFTSKANGTAGDGASIAIVTSSGGPTASSYDGTSNVLTITVASGATAASVTAAIAADASSAAAFDATVQTSGALFAANTADGTTLTGTTAGGANGASVSFTNKSTGTSGNGVKVNFVAASAGPTAAAYDGSSKVLTVTLASGATAASVVAAVAANTSANAVFSTSISNAGTIFAANTTNGHAVSTVAAGGAAADSLVLSAATAGATFNNVSVVFQDTVTAGSETAAYATATNTLTISKAATSTTTQIIAAVNAGGVFSASTTGGGTGTFAAGTTSAVTAGGGSYGTSAQDLQIYQANFGTSSSISAQIDVDTQAKQAGLTYSGGSLSANLVLQVGGASGFQTFNFGNGTTIAQIATALNQSSDATGVKATVNGSDLVLNSTAYGSKAFVSAQALSGTFGATDNNISGAPASTRSVGADAEVRINGVQATSDGLNISLNTSSLNLGFTLNSHLSNGASFNFDVTGGGAQFQLGPDVVSNQQATIGIQGVNTSTLGGADGKLYQLRSGGDKALATDANGAAKIVDEVISSVASLAGRLGAFQSTTLQTNINSLTDTVTNLTQAQSTIRDANFAAESANLTRAQVLVQAGTSVLQIANQNPQAVLKLLQ